MPNRSSDMGRRCWAGLSIMVVGLQFSACQAPERSSQSGVPSVNEQATAGHLVGLDGDHFAAEYAANEQATVGHLVGLDGDPFAAEYAAEADAARPLGGTAAPAAPAAAGAGYVALLAPALKRLDAVARHLGKEEGAESDSVWLEALVAEDKRHQASLDRLRERIDEMIQDLGESQGRQREDSVSQEATARKLRDWQRELEWTFLKLENESDEAARFELRKKVADIRSRIRAREVGRKKRQQESEAGAVRLSGELADAEKLRKSATTFYGSYNTAMTVVAALSTPSDVQSRAEARRKARAIVRIARERGQAVDKELRRFFRKHPRKHR